MPEPNAPEPPTSGADEAAHGSDALLDALVWLTRHHGSERTAASLVAELPVAGALQPHDALRVMREAGYNAGLVTRRIGDLHKLLLPAVLLLRGRDTCILVRRLDEPGLGTNRYEVVLPGAEGHAVEADEAELATEYTGVALVATPRVRAAAANDANVVLRDPGSHWLWGTLRRFVPYYRSALVAALLSNVLMMVSGIVMSVAYDNGDPAPGLRDAVGAGQRRGDRARFRPAGAAAA